MDYIAVLQEKRAAVWAELERLRVQQRETDDRIGLKEMQLRNIDELLAAESPTQNKLVSVDGARPTSSSFLDAAAEILGRRDDGTHYQELLDLLRAAGVNVPGRDPGANLIAHIGRDSRFVRTGRGTYGLRDRHKPAAQPKRVVRKSRARSSGARR